MDDDVVGFHAQQAVAKAIKVTLVLRGIDFPRTHDIDFLLARADGHIDVATSAVEWARRLLDR